ncbi:MAG: HdeD family acid-resistance protein [Paludisphaera borealis]|uniref:HdeD family acid-resistance protein n=1 Tax=Paludisphaera borealis TaxID=1387353 RepID=UPI00283C9C78|nr:HdeD family acid-resistance protein [Paludisphaera borealis]MDR3618454.1 HdeD family acid-resistance protein [Paludisphaera borealis]
MSTGVVVDKAAFRRNLRHELEAIRGRWIWLVILGIAMVVFGTLAMGAPLIASVATAFTLGVLLLMGGAAQLVGAFWTRDWSGFFLVLMMGVLYVVVGLLMLNRPLEALEAMTLLVACGLMVGGLFRAIGSISYQFPQWGWVFVGGLIELALGVMIWMQWPAASLWVIGLFVGIDMLFSGWTWIMLGLRLKHLGEHFHHRHDATTTAPPAHA